MRKIAVPIVLLASAGAVFAAQPQRIELKDGGKVMMKNSAIWKTITEHGTLKPGH